MRVKVLLGAFAAGVLTMSWLFIPGKAAEDFSTSLPAYSAQADYFLRLDGIDGESTNDRHKGEIEIQSFSWGVSQMCSQAGGGGAGKVSFQDITLTKLIDKASPQLMLAAASGQRIKEAVLIGMRPGGGEKYLEIKLTDILVSSFKETGDKGSLPIDQLSLNFSKIEFSYFPQKADGSNDAAVKASWDLKANKK